MVAHNNDVKLYIIPMKGETNCDVFLINLVFDIPIMRCNFFHHF